ncbi:hypothetical protein [Nocardioides sp. Leaf285]|uniref:hypothetical protein n=1 Tax=Nocardioides sp. Leaf285 TaxID=1736322 RepID=UPI000703B96A|nr:hypothetical protein [Nocardioides sp. Leaf285]KQP62935.1 hypothetical protein ASF47_18150 [Nocardioides sp. Leaf285]
MPTDTPAGGAPRAVAPTTVHADAVVAGDGYSEPAPLTECLNFAFQDQAEPGERCGGEVWMRISSGGSRFLKCEACHTRTQAKIAAVRDRYPDSDTAPAWFDPTYAGERWNDDY